MGFIFHTETRIEDFCAFTLRGVRLGFSAAHHLGAGLCDRIIDIDEADVHNGRRTPVEHRPAEMYFLR